MNCVSRFECRIPHEDIASLDAIVRHYMKEHAPIAEKEIELFFGFQNDFDKALKYAGLAIYDESGHVFHHQRRVRKVARAEARRILEMLRPQILNIGSFADLWAYLNSELGGVSGIGEMFIYDTAYRLGCALGKPPKKVYLHAGTRKGAKALRYSGKELAIEIASLPEPLRKLKAWQIEDILCIYKVPLKAIAERR